MQSSLRLLIYERLLIGLTNRAVLWHLTRLQVTRHSLQRARRWDSRNPMTSRLLRDNNTALKVL
jgi:hypothetical protein